MVFFHFGLFVLLLLGIVPAFITSFNRRLACVCAILGGSLPMISVMADSLGIRNAVVIVLGAFGPLVFFTPAFFIFSIQGKTQEEFRSCVLCFIGAFIGFGWLVFWMLLSSMIGA